MSAYIDILLSTYNGGKYLTAQLESLLAQDYPFIRIIIRDDGSTDDTLSIIKCYCQRYSERIILLEDNQHLGAKQSFGKLMAYVSSAYVAFCDQDDVWLPQKITQLFAEMQRAETRYGQGVPILTHSDLYVVNNELVRVADSYWFYAGLDPERNQLAQLLVQNTVTGCAMLANRALIDKARPIASQAIMHDYWLALVASSFGVIIPVNIPLLYYRQHGKNTLGATQYNLLAFFSRFVKLIRGRDVAFSITPLQLQAQALLNTYEDINHEDKKLLSGFVSITTRAYLFRCLFLLRRGVLMSGWLRNVRLMLRI